MTRLLKEEESSEYILALLSNTHFLITHGVYVNLCVSRLITVKAISMFTIRCPCIVGTNSRMDIYYYAYVLINLKGKLINKFHY